MTAFFHGGPAGIWRGGFIVPARELAIDPALTLTGIAAAMGHGDVAPRDRVYVTTSFEAASFYAAALPRVGHVYQVEPIGPTEDDPDCSLPGLSFMCERARVVRVHMLTPKQARRAREALFAGVR